MGGPSSAQATIQSSTATTQPVQVFVGQDIGEARPTQKGVTCNVSLLPKLIALLQQAEARPPRGAAQMTPDAHNADCGPDIDPASEREAWCPWRKRGTP
jgi:hypothetical protein